MIIYLKCCILGINYQIQKADLNISILMDLCRLNEIHQSQKPNRAFLIQDSRAQPSIYMNGVQEKQVLQTFSWSARFLLPLKWKTKQHFLLFFFHFLSCLSLVSIDQNFYKLPDRSLVYWIPQFTRYVLDLKMADLATQCNHYSFCISMKHLWEVIFLIKALYFLHYIMLGVIWWIWF